MIKLSGELTAHDFIVTSLVKACGGAVQFKAPAGLSADQRAALHNALQIPGLRLTVSGQVLCLSLIEEPFEAFLREAL